jgi:hypothetical protein
VGLGEYVQVFKGMFDKLGITGKEWSAFGSFAFLLLMRERGVLILIIFGVPPHKYQYLK